MHQHRFASCGIDELLQCDDYECPGKEKRVRDHGECRNDTKAETKAPDRGGDVLLYDRGSPAAYGRKRHMEADQPLYEGKTLVFCMRLSALVGDRNDHGTGGYLHWSVSRYI